MKKKVALKIEKINSLGSKKSNFLRHLDTSHLSPNKKIYHEIRWDKYQWWAMMIVIQFFFDPKYTNITDYIYDDTYFFFRIRLSTLFDPPSTYQTSIVRKLLFFKNKEYVLFWFSFLTSNFLLSHSSSRSLGVIFKNGSSQYPIVNPQRIRL